MAGTIVADQLEAASTSTLVIKNGVANTPPTIQDSAGTQIGTFCRAWVNFNGTGTVAIRASFNVTSITDNGTGDYTVNFTTAMPDANYSVCGTASLLASGSATPRFVAPTSQAGLSTLVAQIRTANDGGTTEDCAAVYIAIFR
jgi:hypothetical protein